MELAVAGTGYVGLVAGTCFSEMGHNVVCVDRDQEKIRILESGGVPIFEPHLKEMIAKNREEGRLRFSTDLSSVIPHVDAVFIAVGTPQAEDGSCDLSAVEACARDIGKAIRSPIAVAIKSTVAVGTADRVRKIIQEISNIPVDVVSNPEFMKEGAAIEDFMKPDRIIVGTESESARELMADLYAPFNRTSNRIVFMDNRSAEMTKYVANAMLATRISFMNEIANLCERLGADVSKVRSGVGSDPRIGNSFLFPGAGFGGSCFPKDIKALMKTALDADMPLKVLSSVDEVNNNQKMVLVQKVVKNFGENLKGKHFALWGLAFKPQTDDMREAPSIKIIEGLLARGASVAASDPEALHTAERLFEGGIREGKIRLEKDPYKAASGADALLVVTEWNQYRRPDFKKLLELLRQPYIFDGRNLYEPSRMKSMGFTYSSIGR